MLSQAFQYPFRGKGSFRSLLIIALVQFLPVVGQLILLGYGLDIVRAVYAGQKSLPPLHWQTALGDGFRFLLAGFIYLLPILVTIALVGANTIGSRSSFDKLGVASIMLALGVPLLLLLLRIIFVRRPSVQQPYVRKSDLQLVLTRLLPIVVMLLPENTCIEFRH